LVRWRAPVQLLKYATRTVWFKNVNTGYPVNRIGAVGPRGGCSRVTSVVLCEGKEVCSHLIEHFSRTTRILGSFYSQGLELWRLTSSDRCRGGQRDSRSRFVQLNDPKIMQDAFLNELQPLTSRFCKLPSP
jgi:hypothetical protein